MIFSLLFYFAVAKADLKSITQARTLQELTTLASQEKNLLLRHRRCEIELQDGFVPVTCYKWLQQLRRPASQHQLLLSWLDRTCKDAISQNLHSPEYALEDVAVLGAGCRSALKSWSEEWLYKLSREDKQKFMAKISTQFGKEIVIPDGDGTRPIANDYKLSAHKPYRRRLN